MKYLGIAKDYLTHWHRPMHDGRASIFASSSAVRVVGVMGSSSFYIVSKSDRPALPTNPPRGDLSDACAFRKSSSGNLKRGGGHGLPTLPIWEAYAQLISGPYWLVSMMASLTSFRLPGKLSIGLAIIVLLSRHMPRETATKCPVT